MGLEHAPSGGTAASEFVQRLTSPDVVHLAEFAVVGFIGYVIAKNIWNTVAGR